MLAPNTWQKLTGGKDGAGGALLLGAPTKEEAVLFISYCLMEQRWLVATATDHQGHMLENCLINLDYMAQQQYVLYTKPNLSVTEPTPECDIFYSKR